MKDRSTNRIGQTKIYIGKCFRLFVNEKQWKNFLSAFLIMLLISLVTSEDMFVDFTATRKGAFAIICACIWIGLFNSIQSICKERAIIKREHRTGLHISSYILAHVVYELFLSSVEALIVTVLVCIKNMTHLPVSGLILPMYFDLYLTFLLVIFSSDMMAVLISCIVRKENTAMTVMPFILIIQLIMSDFIFELSGISKTISTLTVSRWGLAAVCSIANTTSAVYHSYKYSGMENCTPSFSNLAFLWSLLLLFSAIYILLSILALRRVDSDKR